jgi:hypothetical protein
MRKRVAALLATGAVPNLIVNLDELHVPASSNRGYELEIRCPAVALSGSCYSLLRASVSLFCRHLSFAFLT